MMQSTPLILPFTNIRAADLPLVGGKGANLGELTHAGLPVPAGFCLTTRAFQAFMAACPTVDALYAQLDGIKSADLESARQIGLHVRQTLQDVAMPSEIAAAIQQKWQKLGVDQPYAVRSSATAEDLPDASFAGQQDTYLNVIGVASLLDAVRRCWISLFTDRAILYRIENQFSHRAVQLSVVVQQMVMAETSGILFTADPLTGHRHIVSIDASFGLGEALVSGLVSPDAYRVDKRTMTIIDKQIADKQIAIFPVMGGGVRQENLTATQRAQTVLTDAQIIALAQMGAQVEAHYATPQDIEWALVGEQLFLLQARPITSLYPCDGLQSPDDSLHIFFSMGHQQMMTNAMSPLGISTILCVVPIGHEDNTLESSLGRANGGRLFIDLTQPLRHPILRKVMLNVLAQFNALAPETLQLAMQRPAFQRPHAVTPSAKNILWGLRLLGRVLSALWWEDLTGYVQRADAVLAQDVESVRTKLNALPAGEGQIRATVAIFGSIFEAPLFWIPKFIAGELAHRLIVRLGRGWADPTDLEVYRLGLPGNVVTEMNLVIGDLAEIARRAPQLRRLFEQLGDDSAAWLADAAKVADSGAFFQAWEQFMAHYGSRGSAEIDIYSPRWYEDPLPLLQVIASYLQKEAGSHRLQHQKLVAEREAAAHRLLTQARRGLFGRLRARLMRRLLHVVEHGGVLREHHKFLVVQHFRTIKEIIKNSAVQLTAAQKLTQPDDVWFLSWPELGALAGDDAPDVRAEVAKRRADFARFAKLTPPMVMTSDGESPIVNYHVADAPPGALVGSPVSPGVVEGIVRVIHDPHQETLNSAEILVAPFTDPGWTPLFINAGGLIMEVGGLMTHGSVVAREYGIPAVVGVRDATKKLQTGQRVRLDGNRGVIEIIGDDLPTR